jgi:hypothetical protein
MYNGRFGNNRRLRWVGYGGFRVMGWLYCGRRMHRWYLRRTLWWWLYFGRRVNRWYLRRILWWWLYFGRRMHR